jgi:hypothetical protein
MSWLRDVYSSMVAQIGYDSDKQELIVVWKGGKRSIYEGVSEDTAESLANAPSVGQMMNMEIKPNYSHRYG